MLTVCAVNSKLLGNMKDVVCNIVPVYVFQIEIHSSAVGESFGIASSEHNVIVDLFTGHNKIIRQRLVYLIDCSLYVLI